ncbi:MAG: hypothetical protein HYX84_06655 [Chloroflexi bacterium]|nr:hypothetical protein [Chloroflexota bacterium]
MAKKTILVCDRCGFELAGKADVELALDGTEAWQSSVRGRGEEPRGVFPCKNFVRCRGEMQIVER